MEHEHFCPYCKHGQYSEVDTNRAHSKELIENCGGCGRPYLVVFTVKITHSVSEIPRGREFENF